jgi:ketosteroid isomerase-like protein
MAAADDVRAASKQFYAALTRMANGDSGQLGDAWVQTPDVTSMHPIGGREVGWAAVKHAFDQVAKSASDGRVELVDQLVRVVGDVAYEVGVEHGSFKLAGQPVSIEQRVTNIYQRVGHGWKLIHHHTDVSPAMLDVLRRMPSA